MIPTKPWRVTRCGVNGVFIVDASGTEIAEVTYPHSENMTKDELAAFIVSSVHAYPSAGDGHASGAPACSDTNDEWWEMAKDISLGFLPGREEK